MLTLAAAHERFLQESEPLAKKKAGEALIRAIFGEESILEDSDRAANDRK